MLLFAIFTLGYFFGVFLTLKVFTGKDKVEDIPRNFYYPSRGFDTDLTSREIHGQLIKPNYHSGVNNKLGEENLISPTGKEAISV